MINRSSLLVLAFATSACSVDARLNAPPENPPAATILLKDVVASSLPSPLYHFEYDASGRITSASYASSLYVYDLAYTGGRLAEMRNNVAGNQDRIVYAYDDAGRVAGVRYVDANGVTFTVVIFTYDGQKLTGLERDRRVDGGFIIDKEMSFSYYPDGNLFELTEHRPPIDGVQDEATFVDRFEQYDTGINVDGFDLIHSDFFDHLVVLPGVQVQKSNPRRQTRIGDGINFTVDFTYAYDDGNRPLTKTGDVMILNGSNAGQRLQISSLFTYY
jgi:hypothetical protein